MKKIISFLEHPTGSILVIMNQQNNSSKKIPKQLMLLAGVLACVVGLAVTGAIVRQASLTSGRQDTGDISAKSTEIVNFDFPVSSVVIDDANQNLIVASRKSSELYVLSLLDNGEGSGDFQARLVDVIDTKISESTEPSGFSYVTVNESSGYLIAGTMEGETIAWKTDTNTVTGWSLQGKVLSGAHRGFVASITVSENGKYVSSSGADSIFVWEQSELVNPTSSSWNVTAKKYGAHKGPDVWGLVFGNYELSGSEDSQELISVGNDSRARIWTVQNRDETKYLLEKANYNAQREINSVLFDPITSSIFLGLNNGEIQVIYKSDFQRSLATNLLSTTRPSQTPEAFTFIESHDNAPVRAIAIPKSLDILVTSSNDKKVKVWSIRNRELLNTFEEHEGWATTVDISGDGRYIVSGGEDGNVIIRIMNYTH